jgi:hypothetical protein
LAAAVEEVFFKAYLGVAWRSGSFEWVLINDAKMGGTLTFKKDTLVHLFVD